MIEKKVGELLVESGYVTADQVNQALKVQKTKSDRLHDILIDLGYLSEKMFFEFLSEIPGVVGIDLSSCEIDKDVLELVPAEIALKLEVVPIGRIGDLLTLAMVYPLDDEGLTELKNATRLRIRPVLCSREAIRHVLARHFSGLRESVPGRGQDDDMASLESSMKLSRIAKFVEEIEELPTLPDILTVITSIVNDPKSSAADLAKMIASDASLSGKILKVANSAAYGFPREISDIQQAVTLLGFRETQTLALSASVFDYLTDLTELELKAYWNHSLQCATLSRLISLNLRFPGIEGAFVAGLIHDIGKVALAMSMRGKQERVNSLCSTDGIDRLEAEEKVFGLTHVEAGYLLGEHWLLPVNLTSAIRYHHSPEMGNETGGLVSVVSLANIFCKLDASELKAEPVFSDNVFEILETLKLSKTAFRNTLNIYSYLIPEAVLF
jgi:HD-like signal output (HDOD) protein